MFLRGTLQAQRTEDWCSQRGKLQTQMSNEAPDGLARSVLDSLSGAARAVSYEFPPTSKEDARQETPGSDSHLAPEAWCSLKGTLQAQRAEDWFPEGDIADPQMFNEATDGLAPSVFAIFRAHLEQILALFRQRAKKDPRRGTTGSDLRRAPEA